MVVNVAIDDVARVLGGAFDAGQVGVAGDPLTASVHQGIEHPFVVARGEHFQGRRGQVEPEAIVLPLGLFGDRQTGGVEQSVEGPVGGLASVQPGPPQHHRADDQHRQQQPGQQSAMQ